MPLMQDRLCVLCTCMRSSTARLRFSAKVPSVSVIAPLNGSPVVGSTRFGSFSTSFSRRMVGRRFHSAVGCRTPVVLLNWNRMTGVTAKQMIECVALPGRFIVPSSSSSTLVVPGAAATTMQRSFGPGGLFGSGVQSVASATFAVEATPRYCMLRPNESTSPTSSIVGADTFGFAGAAAAGWSMSGERSRSTFGLAATLDTSTDAATTQHMVILRMTPPFEGLLPYPGRMLGLYSSGYNGLPSPAAT